MEFKSLKNIESSFRQIRLFGIVFVAMCAVVVSVALVMVFKFAEKQREKIYVLDNGKSLMLALSQDMSQNRPAEAREHVRRFHELFFTLSPDKSAIEHNINRALILSDNSAYNYYSDFSEKVTITESSQATSTRYVRWTALYATSPTIHTRRLLMRSRKSFVRAT